MCLPAFGCEKLENYRPNEAGAYDTHAFPKYWRVPDCWSAAPQAKCTLCNQKGGNIATIGDGECNHENNIEDCNYDLGEPLSSSSGGSLPLRGQHFGSVLRMQQVMW